MKQTDFVIGNNKFLINHWSPTKVYKNLPKIGKYFAVPLGIMFGGGQEDASDSIPTALLYLFEKMEEEDINELFKVILDSVHVIGGNAVADHIDEIFQDDPQELLQLVAKTLEVNYGGFFKKGGFEDLLKIVAPMAVNEELYQ